MWDLIGRPLLSGKAEGRDEKCADNDVEGMSRVDLSKEGVRREGWTCHHGVDQVKRGENE